MALRRLQLEAVLDARRYVPLLPPLAALLALLLGVDFLLTRLDVKLPDSGLYDRVFYQNMGAKVARYQARLDRDFREAATRPRLGIALGRSSVAKSIDEQELTDEVGPGYAWLTLFGAGNDLLGNARTLQVLDGLPQRPTLLLYGTHSFMAADAGRAWTLLPAKRDELERHRKLLHGAANPTARRRSWSNRNKGTFRGNAQLLCFRARESWFRFWNQGPRALFSAPPEPLDSVFREFPTAHAPQAGMDFLHSMFAARGYFCPDCFSAQSSGCRALVAVLQQVKAEGAQVVVLLLPEHSRMRADVPEAARRLFRQVVAEVPGVAIWDYQAALPDEFFYDQVHLNSRGRIVFSRMLGRRIRAQADEVVPGVQSAPSPASRGPAEG